MPDLSRALQKCLEAMGPKRDLHQVLRRYAADRDELVALLRLSVELSSLGPPGADPAVRLRIRNRMLAAATRRRQLRRWNPLLSTPRPLRRLAAAGVLATGLATAGFTVATGSSTALPGDALYTVKIGLERAQLAATFDSTARARLELGFADMRLREAQRLLLRGRVVEGMRLVSEYDAGMAGFNQAIAGRTFEAEAVDDLNRFLDERHVRDHASLIALARSPAVSRDPQAAAAVAQIQSRVDQAWQSGKKSLAARTAQAEPNKQPAKPAGAAP